MAEKVRRPAASAMTEEEPPSPSPATSDAAHQARPRAGVPNSSRLTHRKIQEIRATVTSTCCLPDAGRSAMALAQGMIDGDRDQSVDLYPDPDSFPHFVRGRDSVRSYLTKLFASRIVIYDGAMGTMIQNYVKENNLLLDDNDDEEAWYRGERFKVEDLDDGPGDDGSNSGSHLARKYDLLNLTRPGVVREVSRRYLEVGGSDLIGTNTFCSTTVQLADWRCNRRGKGDEGMEAYAYELNRVGARLAREVCDDVTAKDPAHRPRFVVGAMGPTNRNASRRAPPNDDGDPSSRNVTFDELVDSYRKQVVGLVDGGADILLVETVTDTLNARAALYAISEFLDLTGLDDIPVFVSATLVDRSGRTPSGQTPEAFYASIRHAKPMCVGLNCSFGTRDLGPFLGELSRIAECFVHVYANAGLPNPMGGYDDTPEDMAEQNGVFFERGYVNLVGGCCGSTPAHIEAIRKVAGRYAPRKLPDVAGSIPRMWLSGLDDLKVEGVRNQFGLPFLDMSRVPKGVVKLGVVDDCPSAIDTAKQLVANGARILDIVCVGNEIDGPATVEEFVKIAVTEREIAKVPFMFTASNFHSVVAGLKCCQGKSLVSFVSPIEDEDEEELLIEWAVSLRLHGAAVLVTTSGNDEAGQEATTKEEAVRPWRKLYDILVERVHFPPEDIFFDRNC